jgi:hypothetical protein
VLSVAANMAKVKAAPMSIFFIVIPFWLRLILGGAAPMFGLHMLKIKN